MEDNCVYPIVKQLFKYQYKKKGGAMNGQLTPEVVLRSLQDRMNYADFHEAGHILCRVIPVFSEFLKYGARVLDQRREGWFGTNEISTTYRGSFSFELTFFQNTNVGEEDEELMIVGIAINCYRDGLFADAMAIFALEVTTDNGETISIPANRSKLIEEVRWQAALPKGNHTYSLQLS